MKNSKQDLKVRMCKPLLSLIMVVIVGVSYMGVDGMLVNADRTAKAEKKQKVEVKVVKKTTVIKFKTKTKKNKKLLKGKKVVSQKGVDGKREKTYEKTYVDGKLTESVLKTNVIIKKSKEKIVQVGTKKKSDNVQTSRGDDVRYSKVYTMEATAYCPDCDSSGVTATGKKLKVGYVAVDPKVIPLGTKLYVETSDGYKAYGFATAEDTGGAIKGKKIDLYYKTEKECSNFGRRNVKVYVLK